MLKTSTFRLEYVDWRTRIKLCKVVRSRWGLGWFTSQVQSMKAFRMTKNQLIYHWRQKHDIIRLWRILIKKDQMNLERCKEMTLLVSKKNRQFNKNPKSWDDNHICWLSLLWVKTAWCSQTRRIIYTMEKKWRSKTMEPHHEEQRWRRLRRIRHETLHIYLMERGIYHENGFIG